MAVWHPVTRPGSTGGRRRHAVVVVATLLLGACDLLTGPARPPLVFTTLSVGARNTCATTTTNATYCWGNNENGQLGNGDTNKTYATIPVLVSANGQALRLAQVRASSAFACGLTLSGAAYCWGINTYGHLGIGTTVGPWECSSGFYCSATPLPVIGGRTFTKIASGFFNCGLTLSGELYCWGFNALGQLVAGGVPHGFDSPTPVLMSGMPSFITVTVGVGHGCGLIADHTAWCWGHNASGQLGDSSFAYSATPVRVAGGLTFAMLNAGQNHMCGLTSDGAAYCWGSNGRGKVGDNTVIDQFAPVAVMGGLAFVTLSGGWEHTCGVTLSGEAYCWGENAYGQLGDGTKTDRHTPVAVLTGLRFTTVGAGRWHTCGLAANGLAYCWGSNDSGELGDGTTDSRSLPAQVLQ